MKTKKPNFTEKELHDLIDIVYIMQDYPNFISIIKLNKCDKSLESIKEKLEDYCFPELKEKD